MNILVTGSGGQLGHALRRASAASADRYFFTDVAGDDTLRLDITDREAVERFVREHAIGAVVNCAAYTDVERAEEDAERAELLNATAAGHLARAMKGVGGLLVHVSTDYVFDGTANKPCTEETPTAPRSVYGATKLHGEEEVLASGCRYVILRTAWLYSEIGEELPQDDAASDGRKGGAARGIRPDGGPRPMPGTSPKRSSTSWNTANTKAAKASTTSRTRASARGTTSPGPSPNTPEIPPATSAPATATSSPRKPCDRPTRCWTRRKSRRHSVS